jgi:hypothetical protein
MSVLLTLKQASPGAQSASPEQGCSCPAAPAGKHMVKLRSGGPSSATMSQRIPGTGQPAVLMGSQFSEHNVTVYGVVPLMVSCRTHNPPGAWQSASSSQNWWHVSGGATKSEQT